MRKFISGILVLLLILALALSGSATDAKGTGSLIEPFSDQRPSIKQEESRLAAGTFKPEDIVTFTFNESTVFEGSEELQKQIMENGKNPGLGVRYLHDQGITGQGVSVAIIDDHLLPDHPEFQDQLAALWEHPDFPADQAGLGSMRGPAVASLLVGDSMGTAPGAKLYYAQVASWMGDSKQYADALHWILETNKTLPDSEKIRVVSISAAPSGEGSPFEKNQELYDKAVADAQAQGLLILDCRADNPTTGIIQPAYFDPEDPDNLKQLTAGFAGNPFPISGEYPVIGVPASYRTLAEEYEKGQIGYQYSGNGGLNWAIPYASGVLAMGWQVNPELTGQEMAALLMETAYQPEGGDRFINPIDLIEAVRQTVK
jgi:hypothetical protein